MHLCGLADFHMRPTILSTYPRLKNSISLVQKRFKHPTNTSQSVSYQQCSPYCFIGASTPIDIKLSSHATTALEPSDAHRITGCLKNNLLESSHAATEIIQGLVLADLDPTSAKLAITYVGPFLSAFSFLFILRIIMSWYPKLPVEKFPYIIAYAPTEPILVQTRKVIPPLGGVDVTPVVWFGLISFLSEILVGPQGLLVLLSQQTS